MKILVTNDDGIDAPGLKVLARELQKVERVIVVAPEQEQSGVGTSISLHQPIKVKKLKSWKERIEAYSVGGTPSDSVLIATQSLFPGEIGLVVSGINRGANMGYDVCVSGTVGAALQGYLHGITSMAISIDAYENLNFDVAAKLASLLAANIKSGRLAQKTLLNINLPDLPLSEIAGIDITRLSKQSYCDRVEKELSDTEEHYRIRRNNKNDLHYRNLDDDCCALRQNRISITALPDSFVGNSSQHCLKDLAPAMYSELHKTQSKPLLFHQG